MFTFRFDFLADRRRDPPRERTEAESSSSGENHETKAESSSQGKKTTEKGSHRGREERSGILEISSQRGGVVERENSETRSHRGREREKRSRRV